ncbi:MULTISPECIES: endonuclease domain-containing protein [Sphingobium]|uniref:endonuclease domain-containing protein n=1 Tax=Sphingobium TaxID=165695 RepID=UPI00182DB634|nr:MULTISPECIES: endonuclease domain-containing protein [Sphingobium]MCW2362649.1 very-short-patch-repair endonuclease [Sphingobium sp. B10D3B]MCW2400671.1 very-short-patch-repair endonuclease [Sphingobium sp. B10D7B]MCW2407650.1 very-short-patch-repair endonuclease [Sphingobium xanthum]
MTQDARLLIHAKAMRHEATPCEIILWRHLSRSQLGGHKFRRQHVLGPFIVDFFCPAKKLIVEVDGDTHDPEEDTRRDAALTAEGHRVLRFTNEDVRINLTEVLEAILTRLNSAPARWAAPSPTPSPPLKGRG